MFQMKNFKYAGAVLLAVGAMSQAVAAPTPSFKVDTALFEGANAKNFSANFLNGAASSLLFVNGAGPNTITGRGYTRFSSFSNGGDILDADQTGLKASKDATSGYLLWAEYSFKTSYVSGPFAGAGSSYKIYDLTFQVFGEKANGTLNNSTFIAANNTDALTTANSAKVTHSGDTVLLGSGTLVSGVSTINGDLGTSFNPTMDFVLTTPEGTSFFYDPSPFYQLAFSSFTNTQGGFVPNASGVVAINNASGGADFNNKVPEPAGLALVALALVAAGGASKRRRQA